MRELFKTIVFILFTTLVGCVDENRYYLVFYDMEFEMRLPDSLVLSRVYGQYDDYHYYVISHKNSEYPVTEMVAEIDVKSEFAFVHLGIRENDKLNIRELGVLNAENFGVECFDTINNGLGLRSFSNISNGKYQCKGFNCTVRELKEPYYLVVCSDDEALIEVLSHSRLILDPLNISQ